MFESHDLLKESIRRHVAFGEKEFELLLGKTTQRKYRKGQFLLSAGSVLRKTHFVRRGLVIAYFVDNDGNEHLIQFAMEGWWISDIHSFIEGSPSLLYVQALENSEVYEIAYDDLQQLFALTPALESYFYILTQRAFASFQVRTLSTLSHTAAERYRTFLEKYPQLENRLPQKLIASYIGVTPAFLSRMKRELLLGK